MGGEREARAQKPALQPPTKENSKEGVGEDGQIHGPKTGLTGYVPPPDAIGDTGGQVVTSSQANKYELWLGLDSDRVPQKQPALATGSSTANQQEIPGDRRGEEENNHSQEEFDSADSHAEQHLKKEEQSGDPSHAEENLDQANL
jgi:hypothetical protein